MTYKIVLKSTFTIIGLTVVGFTMAWVLLYSVLSDRFVERESVAKVVLPSAVLDPIAVESLFLPVRLIIPSIKVDAVVDHVGLTADGVMMSPKTPEKVVWFELGVIPGNRGSAVIAGHSGWKNNRQATFDNLNKVIPGDKIFVTDETGTTTIFVVKDSRLYDPKADASDVFQSADNISHLNLITCDGVWNARENDYSSRLVVFADKE